MPLVIPFKNIYTQLPEICFSRVLPTPVKAPHLIQFNQALADDLGIEITDVNEQQLAEFFSGNLIPEGADPLAMAYSGHQFGHLNPQLGDGRAILLGDVINRSGEHRDIQLKGSGRTPYSRGGDGRSPLGPAMREYIMCEAMHALGVPTTRALALVASGEPVVREQREPGAVFSRVAASHIRVGTFQYFALRQDERALKAMSEHVLERHYSYLNKTDSQDLEGNTNDDRYLRMFEAVCERQAHLIAQWMQLGFIHGVMNTDNMTISGETIDYGPCAFMDGYNPEQKYSAIDQRGRYAFRNQPSIAQWNLARLGESLLMLFPGDEQQAIDAATAILNAFPARYQHLWYQAMYRKIGLSDRKIGLTDHNADQRSNEFANTDMIDKLLALMTQGKVDYSLFFRRLCDVTQAQDSRDALLDLIEHPTISENTG
ncbi:MAG: YdiU family protein, partial [Oleibacter sp.]|nr:YdiU family protein [Thalassolituus sp.]